MSCCRYARLPRRAARGSTLLLTLLLTALLSMEILSLGAVLSRGLSSEGQLAGDHVRARTQADWALSRSETRLRAFLNTHAPAEAEQVFARAGRLALYPRAAAPQSAGSELPENASLRVWLHERRGRFYHLIAESRHDRVRLTVHRWLHVP